MKTQKKKVIILGIISIILSIICVFVKKYDTFLVDRIIIFSFIIFFCGLHFIFGFKTLYNFIIKYRYRISAILIILFTILGYSGSSIGILSHHILEQDKNNTIIGVPRGINSDEYALETLISISQKNNGFSYYNNLLRGTKTDVFSILHVPVNDIVSISRIFNIGYYFLNSDMALALWWNLRLFALILVSFELCMIITNKNEFISICGSIIIAFSGVCQWWISHHIVDIMIFGQMFLVLTEKFMQTKSLKIKFICIFGITLSVLGYIFTQYPAWMISFGYVFLAMFIWILIKNKKNYKITIGDILLIIGSIIAIGLICLRYFILSAETLNIIKNTAYPGKRNVARWWRFNFFI